MICCRTHVVCSNLAGYAPGQLRVDYLEAEQLAVPQ